MKQVTGYWFAPRDNCLANGDGRKISLGITHHVDGGITPCEHGLHLSKHPFDALQFAPGPILYKVIGFGTIIPHGKPVDKYACSHRKYIAGGIDITSHLRKFACNCALSVVNLWDCPDIVRQYLETQDESIRDAARAAARSTARFTARAAASAAASDAARAAAWDAAWAAARDAARAAAWVKVMDRQRKDFKKLVYGILKGV